MGSVGERTLIRLCQGDDAGSILFVGSPGLVLSMRECWLGIVGEGTLVGFGWEGTLLCLCHGGNAG